MHKKLIIFVIVLFILTSSVKAATIHGQVYDFDLNKLTNVVVEIDTSPKQSTIIKNQGYLFNVPQGNYTISAIYVVKGQVQASTKENILIKDDTGQYTLDLILFPDLGGDELFNDTNIDVNLQDRSYTAYIYIAGLIILLVALFLILKALRHKRMTVPEDHALITVETKTTSIAQDDKEVNKVLDIIKKNDGRTTQKDIRKQLNLSEAKISLIITQLEAQQKIKKIKKGRGNIIILNK